MKKSSHIVLTYGLVLMVLGSVGFYYGSVPSLYAGGGLGLLLVLSSFAMRAHKKWGGYAAFGFTLLLTGVFSFRYLHNGKPVPGIMALVSAAMLIYLLVQLGKWRKG